MADRKKAKIPSKAKIETGRSWEVWDEHGKAENIDAYWRGSQSERQHRRSLAVLVKTQMLSPAQSLLEVGCGTGLVYAALIDEVGTQLHYLGIDNSEAMLKIAKSRYGPVVSKRFEDGDAFALRFSDGEFDIAFAFEVFGHMPSEAAEKGIKELHRVAKKRAIFTMWLVDAKEVWEGPDGRYSYPRAHVDKMIKAACGDSKVSEVNLGLCTAFVVNKT